MATLNRLKPKQIASAEDGWLADGGGLYLRVRGDGKYRHWFFRSTRNGKPIEISIGAIDDMTLANARAEAARLREMVGLGKDPIRERRRAEAELANHRTFGEVAQIVIERKKGIAPSSLRGWNDSLLRDAERLHDIDVADVTVDDVKHVVGPIFGRGHHVQAKRTLTRISAVMNAAVANGWRSAANCAAWSVFQHIAPEREKADRRHPMLSWQDAPAAIDAVRVAVGVGPRALEFMILTAVRLTEATAAEWSEINIDAKIWTIPASRMKARAEHVVPLSKRALAILDEMAQIRVGAYVFPGREMRRPVGAKTVQLVCDTVTDNKASPHGWRATFRSWCGAHGVDRELAEVALAHTIQGVEGVYHRDVMLERRRPVMDAWSDFVEGKTTAAKVVPFQANRR